MKKVLFYILVGFLLISCNGTKFKNTESIVNDSIISQRDYFINKRLNSISYEEYKTYVPNEGYVPNADVAFQIAEIVLKQIYGQERIDNQKPFSINLFRGVWVVEGSLNCIDCVGGVAYIEIQKSDGKILKVIHTK